MFLLIWVFLLLLNKLYNNQIVAIKSRVYSLFRTLNIVNDKTFQPKIHYMIYTYINTIITPC